MKKQAKRIFWNAMLLTASTLLVRTVGVSFQVYVSNRVGAEAMGLFSLMSGVYGFALTLATSGIHLGVTHVVIDAVGRGERERIRGAMRRAVCYSLFFGCLASLLLIGFAEPIGTGWLKDARTVPSLRLFGITLPLISLSSAFGGYFTAMRRAYKNAVVQVLEQMLKIGFTSYLLTVFVARDIEQACAMLVLGGVLSEVASFLFEWILYLTDRGRSRGAVDRIRARADGKMLIGISLPIALTAYARSGLITLEHILIPEGLRNSGASHAAALTAYGCIQGMALPIVLYPAALISAFSGLLVPELAECRVQESKLRIRYMISRVWSLALIFSIGTAGILLCFSGEIGEALYPHTDAGKYIRLLAPLIPIMYVDTATDAMLKGLGEQVYSMKINILDALISVVLVWILVPHMGIGGYLVTIYFSETFNTVFSVTRLLSISRTPVRVWKWVGKPLLCVVGATCMARMVLWYLIPHHAIGALPIALHILLATGLYLILLRMMGGIDREDLEWISSLFRWERPVRLRLLRRGRRISKK